MTNLLGISGKKGVGKDTVAKIIQMLTCTDMETMKELRKYHKSADAKLYNIILEKHGNKFIEDLSQWKTRRFADKLKDIVCLLIGCTREQLEDPEFKETPLGEEWSKYPVSINTVINPLDPENSEQHEELHYFSTKEEAERFADIETVEGYDYEAEAFVEDKEIMTPRKILQELGTEVCREIHPQVWVNALFADYRMKPVGEGVNFDFKPVKHPFKKYEFPNWIVPDVRFPNEYDAIKERGGVVIRIDKPVNQDAYYQEKEHGSEKALDNHEFNYRIDNNGTIEDLVEEVRVMLKHFVK